MINRRHAQALCAQRGIAYLTISRFAASTAWERRMMLAGLHHVAIIAGDYATSKQFYCQILGLRVLDEHYRQTRDSWKLDPTLPDGGQMSCSRFPTRHCGPAARKHAACATSPFASTTWMPPSHISTHTAWRPKTFVSTNTPAAASPSSPTRMTCRWSCTRSAELAYNTCAVLRHSHACRAGIALRQTPRHILGAERGHSPAARTVEGQPPRAP
ncbi:glyoxylase I family protein [Xanthomonas oryzae pv. oryzae KACC 10331]|uniref:Glyoxylase I family protein n=1 Tax=Xanthomonas oryzae pv. oryzae (strain KACC10331 / KXO85) TaxID=291331 RepID=Q5H1J1_XANOR|nr:glyoxylase I family protein [Xanthomonas oryzae pv. oryzae KACC 10331]